MPICSCHQCRSTSLLARLLEPLSWQQAAWWKTKRNVPVVNSAVSKISSWIVIISLETVELWLQLPGTGNQSTCSTAEYAWSKDHRNIPQLLQAQVFTRLIKVSHVPWVPPDKHTRTGRSLKSTSSWRGWHWEFQIASDWIASIGPSPVLDTFFTIGGKVTPPDSHQRLDQISTMISAKMVSGTPTFKR